ncbi:SDR family NAD(P)-dependent oxidoreductase [Rhodococcus hoagii]|nr:SDR family NAD(P)-dependent oxidoreductase [Prescottella equi]
MVEKEGRRIVAYKADVRDYDALEAGLTAAVEGWGGSTSSRRTPASSSSATTSRTSASATGRDVIDVNVTAYYTCKAAVPHLIRGGRGGTVVITSSDAGTKGFARFGHM